jgi:hypothetical protein
MIPLVLSCASFIYYIGGTKNPNDPNLVGCGCKVLVEG